MPTNLAVTIVVRDMIIMRIGTAWKDGRLASLLVAVAVVVPTAVDTLW